MFELALYILTIAYLTKILLLDHQHYCKAEAKAIVIGTLGEPLVRRFDWMDRLRQKIFSYEEREHSYHLKHTGLTQLFLCPYCLSFWLNLILLPLLNFIANYPDTYYFFFIFAIPYVVGFIHER